MKHGWTISLLAAVALVAAPPALAASRKSTVKKAVVKKPVAKPPEIVVLPIVPGGFMVPKAVVLRNPTPAEAAANAVWNVRAGLNVAALQCQFRAI